MTIKIINLKNTLKDHFKIKPKSEQENHKIKATEKIAIVSCIS